jgi:flagellar basal-body rod protein FlgC
MGANLVRVDSTELDATPFRVEHNPGHPAADANGYVKLPNVNMLVEMADMREANRSYMANLQMIKQAREMISMTIDLLRST